MGVVPLPFKLILFVLVDGWHLVAGSLVQGYGGSVAQLQGELGEMEQMSGARRSL